MPTIPELVRRSVAAYGGRVAVVDGDRTLTFAEVGSRSARVATALSTIAAPLDRVAILLRNRLEYVEIDFGVALASMVKVPINPRLSDDERAFVVADSAARVLITETEQVDRVVAMLAALDDPPTLIVLDGGSGPGTSYAEMLRASDTRVPGFGDPDRISQFLYTSGTTGRPKAAVLTDRCRVSATTMMLAEEYPAGPDDGMIHAGPLAHGSGSKVLTFFLRGARNVILPAFDPHAFFTAVDAAGGTCSFVVPTMIQTLVEALDGAPPPSRLRNLSYGGAAITRKGLDAALNCFGPILTQVYGSCEAPHPVLALRHRDEDDPAVPGESAVPAGRPVVGADVRLEAIADTTDGNVGQICVRGPNVMQSYWHRADATAEALANGWYRTGDVGRVTDDGLYYIVDRVKDLVISGGLNVYPAEVERVLNDHPDIHASCVVGLPDERWGEVVAAAVVPEVGAELGSDEVRGWCGDRLAGYKKPRRVLLLDQLPTGSTGKIQKRDARALFADTSR